MRDLEWRDKSLASLNDNQTSVNTSNLGRDAEVAQAEESVEVYSQPLSLTIAGEETDYPKFVTHPVKIYHFLWDTSTVTGNITKDVFQDYLSSMDAKLKTKLSSFYYMKAKLKIRVVLQGATQYFGQMRLVFTPWVFLPTENNAVVSPASTPMVHQNTVSNCAILPHITLDPSKNITYELSLDCPTPLGYWTPALATDSINVGSYSLDAIVINNVRSGTAAAPTGSTGVNFCIYAYLEDPELIGLTMFSLAKRETKASDIFSTVSGVAKMAASAGVFTPYTTLFSQITGSAAVVLRHFGFSNPPSTEVQTMILNRTCDNYSQVEGTSTAIVLGASQKQGVSIDPSVAAGDPKEMTVSHICSLPNLLFADVLVTNSTGSELLVTNFVVSPSLLPLDLFHPTTLSALSYCHGYWCGDMTYTFEIVASVFSRASLVVAWQPMGSSASAAAPSLQVALNTMKTVTIQVVGNTSVDVTIPYKSLYPALRCQDPFLWNAAADQTIEGVTNGVVFLYCLNPVVDNGSATPTIAVNVWQRSDNIAFFAATPENIGAVTLASVNMTGSEMVESTQSVIFGSPANVDDVNLLCFGDRSTSVKQIAARVTAATIATYTASATVEWLYTDYPNLPPMNYFGGTGLYNGTAMSLYGYIASAYLGTRGSTRASFEVRTMLSGISYAMNPVCMAAHRLNAFATGWDSVVSTTTNAAMVANQPYAWTQPNLQVSSRVDVSVPMMFTGRFHPNRALWTNIRDCIRVMFTESSGELATSDKLRVTGAFGAADDVVFTRFLGFPTINTGTP